VREMIPIVPDASSSPPRLHSAPLAFLAPGTIRLSTLPPLTLYVHIPWCVRKCPYCDFNSHEAVGGVDGLPEQAYLSALRTDLEDALPLVWGRRVHAVFIGGGTPSLFSAAAIDTLLADIRARLPLDADAEITLEANPGTFEAAKFANYRRSGVNRLSIGIQSFDDDCLAALGRIHDSRQAQRAIEIARGNFENFNLDLMYGLPGQTLAAAERDIELARSYGPPHLSLYQLTIEPNTAFAKYPPALPADDITALIEKSIDAMLGQDGFERYEVSAWAQPAVKSRHNLNYWNFGDYLGIGAGAHSKLSFPERVVRQVRYRQPKTYLDRAGQRASLVQEEHEVKRVDLPFEFMLNALRLVDGFPASRFFERTGVALFEIESILAKAQTDGLIERDPGRLRPTPLGLRFLNDLQERFLLT